MTAPPQSTSKPSLKQRLQALLAEYGPVAVAVWFGLFLLTWAGFALAISLGLQPEGAAASAGAVGGGYVAAQLTKPVRIAATLALTPLVGRLWKRLRRRKP